MKPIYLDYNATTPLAPEVVAAMRPYLEEHFGNPSSTHGFGARARQAVERARGQVAGLLGCDVDEVVFTSGGSESNNHAIKGAVFARAERGDHVVTSAIEHPAVYEVCRFLERRGLRVTYLPVDGDGRVDPDELRRALNPRTILVTIMHANNEVGTIQPIREIAAIVRERGILLHTDAAQSAGKVPTRVHDLGVDLLSLAGHKLYAPKGVGALYVRRGVELESLIHGAGHERGSRAGTENVAAVVGLGTACEIAREHLDEQMAHGRAMRDRLGRALARDIHDMRVHGDVVERLPNTLSVGFAGVEANTVLDELEGLAASAGAACHADSVDISPTLAAMNVPVEYAMGTIRFSTGRFTTANEVDTAARMIADAVNRLRGRSPETVARDEPGEIRLTRFTHGLGCACKLRPQALEEVLSDLPRPDDERILVGLDTGDDAAVYRLDAETAIVQTVDFFTPIVDDPYQFGAIAAANAFSDVYAMGGRPLFALNVVAFPSNRLPLEVLKRILEGARDKAAEAGVSIVGGHTIDDTEPKFGLAVTGLVHPDEVLTNARAVAGDALVLTKPLGLGIMTTALKRGMLDRRATEKIVAVMSALNGTAAEQMRGVETHACTDVTGFGLLGHLKEMAEASGVDVEVLAGAVPVLDGALELVVAGAVPGGTTNNLRFVESCVSWDEGVPDAKRTLLADAQTSGGLLIAVDGEQAGDLVARLKKAGVGAAAVIGRVVGKGSGGIRVRV